ncbi:MAG: phosphoribosylanthranilate isomerase [Chromatiales bacterium]
MSRVRVKFCGITRAQDAIAAAQLGVDAIGLVFHPASPRAVSSEQARAVTSVLPPFVAKVGLFVNAERRAITRTLAEVCVDVLQFHGDEMPEQCRGFGKPYVKAIRMHPGVNLAQIAGLYQDAAALLLDAYEEGLYGGTGTAFDWALAAQSIGKPLVLAGGLTPANVGAAIAQVHPYAVDVSGGIEATKGVKDPAKMQAFMQEVQRGSSSTGGRPGASGSP